jgi:V8-like Glu-specific endopeptidase
MIRAVPNVLRVPYALDRLADEADYAVVGPVDGRERVDDTRQQPYSAVCHIERDFGDGRLTGCTAFLIGPKLLLTAAHCVMSALRDRLGLPSTVARIRVSPGRASAHVRPFGSQWAAVWRAHPDYLRRPLPQSDVAVIELTRPFEPSPGHLQLIVPDAADLERLRQTRLVHISGYPGDKPNGTQWEHAERLDRITARQLLYSVDTCPGHSGAPVWIRPLPDSPAAVVAVHTAGPRPHAEGAWGCRAGVPLAPAGLFNRGVRMTPALRNAIMRGLR